MKESSNFSLAVSRNLPACLSGLLRFYLWNNLSTLFCLILLGWEKKEKAVYFLGIGELSDHRSPRFLSMS